MKALAYILIILLCCYAVAQKPVSGYESKNCYELRATSGYYSLPLECRSK